ncbi:exo-alpha-sialidase [Streptomyces sp. HC307]|uniref:exo-alpha-sialidase n=1 Tax=Streptomyces flavusporus TaxID=3385496 RepID=UPI0039172012
MDVRRWRLLLVGALLVCLLAACSAGTESVDEESAGAPAKKNTHVPASSESSFTAPPNIPSATDLPGASYDVAFAADGSGFTLRADCGEDRCRQYVAVLEANAGLWRLAESPLPDVTGDRGLTAGLTVLGPGRALITDSSEWTGVPSRTWFTRDNGRTWEHGTAKPTGTTPTVPESASLVTECVALAADGNECARNRLLVVMPDTGEHRILTHQPPLEGTLAPAGDIAGNALFATGLDPDSGLPTLVLSEDRGRTWRPTHMTGVAEQAWPLKVVAGRSALYAVQPGQLPSHEEVKNGLRTLHVSTDGGTTWTRIWRYREGVEPLSLLGDLLVADDNSLVVYGETGVWRSIDQARTFRSDSPTHGPAGSVRRTPIGWLWTDSYGNGTCRISADGRTWHIFNLGED